MSSLVLIDDFPKGFGGSEIVNNTVALHFKVDKFISSSKFDKVESDVTYIISNTSTMSDFMIASLSSKANYIILEHDYKFVRSRHPWRYEDCIVPKNEVINKELYKNAKAIFVQTDDHLSVFIKNKIDGNFISLKSSIWSNKELDVLEKILNEHNSDTNKFCIIESDNWIKNQKGAEQFLNQNKIDYNIERKNHDPEEFLRSISNYPCLVFLPIARESCCRLLVEAKCLGMNVITNKNSGAWQSDWFSLSGKDLIEYLRKQSKSNLEIMESYL